MICFSFTDADLKVIGRIWEILLETAIMAHGNFPQCKVWKNSFLRNMHVQKNQSINQSFLNPEFQQNIYAAVF